MGLTRINAQQISNIDYKQAVRVITITNITLAGGAPSSVDDVNLVAGDRILVAGQTTGSQNGLYIVQTVGAGSNGTWVRSSDGNETGEIEAGMIVMVTEGTSYSDTQWKLITNNPITIGTTALVFEQSSAYSFGTITANAVGIVADTVGDTVTFTPGDNFIISGNATTDTITFGVSQSPTFTGTTSVAALTVSGNVTGNLLPSANITYDLGSNTQRWKDIWLANSTIYLGGAQISANTTALTITNPAGGTTVLSGATPAISATTITATGNVTGGNIVTTGQVVATGNITGGNINTAGNVTAEYFLGNVSQATGIFATKIFNGTSEANITSSGGNLEISIGGTADIVVVSSTGLETSGTLTASGNVTGSNILGNGSGLSGINVFSNVTISGGNSALASGIADTLTLTAGDGITIVADAGNNIVTIATSGTGDSIFATGGDMGTVEEAVTASEDLGLVTETPAATEIDMGTIVQGGILYPDQLVLPAKTVAELANISATPAGQFVFCSNESGGSIPAFSDGTNWRRVSDRAIIT